MRKEEKKINDKGFSLVELIVVIAIMVALVAVVAVAVTRYVAQSRAATDVTNAQTIKSAIQVEITDPTDPANEKIPTAGQATYDDVPSGMASLPELPSISARDMKSTPTATWQYRYDKDTGYVAVTLSKFSGATGVTVTASGSDNKDLTNADVANFYKKQTSH